MALQGKIVPSKSTQLTRVVTIRMPSTTHNALISLRASSKQSMNTLILLAIEQILFASPSSSSKETE